MPKHEDLFCILRISALCEAFLKTTRPDKNPDSRQDKKSSFYQWFELLKYHKGRYFFAISAGLLSILTSTGLVLLVTYAISILQGSLRPVGWSELVGEHASRWIGPLVRNTAYEDGLSVGFQKLFIVPALIGVALLGNFLKTILEYTLEDLGESITRDLRHRITGTYLESNYQQAKTVPAALIASFLGDDTREIRQCFTRLCGSVPIELVASFVYLCLLALLDTQLFVLFFAIFLPAGIVVRATGKYLRTMAKMGINIQTELTQSFLEKMRGWQTIQSFAAQKNELNRFDKKNTDIFNVWRRSARAKSLSSPSVEWLGIAAGACVLILALRRVSEGALPSSILTAFLITVAQLSNSFQTVVNQLNTTKKGNAALRRINEFLNAHAISWTHERLNSSPDANHELALTNVLPISLSTSNVTIHHPTQSGRILCRDISFELNSGDTLAIVGPSGAGKSTLLECISGLRPPDAGTVKLHVQNKVITNQPILANHLKVAYLSQEPFIFDSSILENVVYPEKPDPNSRKQIEHVRSCLKLACLDYKDIHENALSLSGGEKQRIAFARGFVRMPHVWMIDEGTSALDAETEIQIVKNLKEHSPDSIKVLIAHRTALRNFANKHLVIES